MIKKPIGKYGICNFPEETKQTFAEKLYLLQSNIFYLSIFVFKDF